MIWIFKGVASIEVKIIPVCIQYDTTDANLELTVYAYDLVIS
jgi:hypothetical protein